MSNAKKSVSKKQSTKKTTTKINRLNTENNAVKETKSIVQKVVGTKALVKISIFSPGYSPIAQEIVIPDIIHNTTLNHRDPKEIGTLVLMALKAKYGNKVKNG